MGLTGPPEIRAFAALLQVRAGGDGRTVTGLIAPFYAPTPIGGRYTEMFEPGSFRLDRVPLYPGHPRDDRDFPISPPGSIWEGRGGVHGEWHLSRTTRADELLVLLGDDPPAISGLSVGFFPDEDEDQWSPDGRVVTRRGAQLDHVAAVPKAAYAGARVTSVRAELAAGGVNDLPDEAFAWIEPGGARDGQGKTVPRSLRYLPVHDKVHVQNALSRLSQTQIPEDARRKAFRKIAAAADRFGVEVSGDMKRKYGGQRSAPPPGSPLRDLEDLNRRHGMFGAAALLRAKERYHP